MRPLYFLAVKPPAAGELTAAGRGRPGMYLAGSQAGQEQPRRAGDEDRLDGEGSGQPEVIGEAAEQVRGGDHEHAAEELDAGVGRVAVVGRGGQRERE